MVAAEWTRLKDAQRSCNECQEDENTGRAEDYEVCWPENANRSTPEIGDREEGRQAVKKPVVEQSVE